MTAKTQAKLVRRAVKAPDGSRYYSFGPDDVAEWVSHQELVESEKTAMTKIGRTGTPVMTPKAKTAIKAAVEEQTIFDDALVAERPGWLRYDVYVHANGEVQKAEGENLEVIVAFQPDSGWSQQGTLDEWKSSLATTIAHSQVAVTLLCYAFSPILLSSAPPRVINPSLQLVGPAESGKSTLALLAASVYGGDPKSEIGIGRTWDTTLMALPEMRRMSNDALLFLDEESVMDEKVKSDLTAVFQHASSGGRARYDAAGRQPPVRAALLSTANAAALAGAKRSRIARAIQDAAATRVITLAFDGSLIQEVPAGYTSAEDLMRQISAHAATFYGSASRAFVGRVIDACTEDHEAFRKQVSDLITRFESRAHAHPHGSGRIRTAFGLIYAAGCLAVEWDILPIDKKAMRKSITAMYDLAEPIATPSESAADAIVSTVGDAVTLFRKVVEDNTGKLRYGRRPKKNGRRDAEVVLGHVTKEDGATNYYLRRDPLREICGKQTMPMLKLLKEGGYLRHDEDKLQIKAPLQSGLKGRVYHVVLPA